MCEPAPSSRYFDLVTPYSFSEVALEVPVLEEVCLPRSEQ